MLSPLNCPLRTFWFSNLILYVAFVIFLTTFIFLRFGGAQLQVNAKSDNGNDDGGVYNPDDSVVDAESDVYEFNNASKAAVFGLSAVLAVLCVVLVMREAFQMLASFKRYFLRDPIQLKSFSWSCGLIFHIDSDTYELPNW